jgi:formamidopyrimidine-DNA glycosylase
LPELPEVQTIVNDLGPKMINRKITDIKILTRSIWRYKYPRKGNIIGARVTGISRRGKYIVISLSGKYTWIVHLGMTGRLVLAKSGTRRDKHTHVIMRFSGFEVHYNDIRRFGFMDLLPDGRIEKIPYLKNLGPDPFELDETGFMGVLKSRKRMIKQLLMDQNVISGLGNIYSDEILFGAGIHPRAISSRLRKKRISGLYNATIETLNLAIRARGSSISDFVDGSGEPGGYQDYHSVYGREGKPCVKCGTPVRREKIAGRSAHYCPRCQR